MTLNTILRLGRVSNLPTVWTNALAGAVLAGGATAGGVALAAAALTLFYVGGMWLNDAYDAEIDASERPGRPIPAGEIDRGIVFAVGYALLAGGVLFAFAGGALSGAVGLLLAVAIVVYDRIHKVSPLGPLAMAATRFLAYGLAAAGTGAIDPAAFPGAVGLFAWVVGLTYAARQEAHDRIENAWPLLVLAVPLVIASGFAIGGGGVLSLVLLLALAGLAVWAVRLLLRRGAGDVPRAVVTLIAGISLYDATLIAAQGQPWLALLAAGGFALTLLLQRVVPGT